MKKKFLIVNLSLVVAVLFSILFQSLDSFSHFENQKTELKCHHKSSSKHEIIHHHHTFENCLVCKFAFSSAVSSSVFSFKKPKIVVLKSIGISEFKPFQSFYSNSNPHRGPPFFNV